MPRNERLAEVVIAGMTDFLMEKESSFRLLCDGERDFGMSLIQMQSRVDVDENAKFRMAVGRFLGYGYDFNGEVDGMPARQMYENGVRNTKENSGHPCFETFIDSGIVDERYGWYITTI